MDIDESVACYVLVTMRLVPHRRKDAGRITIVIILAWCGVLVQKLAIASDKGIKLEAL